jgi:hypothetical protein
MSLLLRLRVRGSLVSLRKTPDDKIGITIHGPAQNHPEEVARIHGFLEKEGIIESVQAGNTSFAEQILLDASAIGKLTRRWEKL